MAEFDWVTARAECSAHLMFAKLKDGILRDVEARNKLRDPDDRFSFVTEDDGSAVFYVMRNMGAGPKTVKFTVSGGRIVIAGDDMPTLTATLTLTDEGHCVFKIDGTEYEPWQLRKKALEDVFFNF